MEPFSFAFSHELQLPVSVRINSLDGHRKPLPFSVLLKRPDLRHRGSNASTYSELYVTAQIWADSKPLTIQMQTPYKAFKSGRVWNEWLEFPVSYCNLPLSAQLAVTVWDLSPTTDGESGRPHAVAFGGTTIRLYDEDNTLQKGRQRCRLHLNRPADGLSSTTTPSTFPATKKSRQWGKISTANSREPATEMERLEGLMKMHEMGEIPENKWLDQLVFREIEKLERKNNKGPQTLPKNQNTRANSGVAVDRDHLLDEETDENNLYLYIEFPRFDHPIVFADREYPPAKISPLLPDPTSEEGQKHTPEVTLGPGINENFNGHQDVSAGGLIKVYDPEVGMKESPAEGKHRRLVRSHRTGIVERDLKPNPKARDDLNSIMSHSPSHELSADDKDLVWKFRHHLTREKRALTKFVKSVAWNDRGEARQAVQLLPKWTEIDVDDALELLGPSFDNPAVRAYAVDRLKKADDEELLVYLLQLVQALKYETTQEQEGDTVNQGSSLAQFLISRAVDNEVLGNFLHWYLMVECDDRSAGQGDEHRRLFAKVEYDFMTELMKRPDGTQRRKVLQRQAELITLLSKISKDVRFSREDRPRKIERLKRFLADPKNELNNFDPLPLPLDPTTSITGILVDECNVFKSSLYPLLINFRTDSGSKYPVLFKTGDDLRQDQLVIQIITLMDRLLRKENLDLKLTPYRTLATSTSAGVVQFVPSLSLAAAVAKYKGVLAYLRANNPDTSSPLGVRKEAMDTYVKSCAGYCVITYLLGVGDRHLDNLLIAPSGHFFHADFGYILGRDPKPFAPLMKLGREMIEGMGGPMSPQYASFKEYCFTAYTTLRKSANLILNLFALMREANIPDIRIEPDKAVWKVEERMCLDLTEEGAIRHFEGLIQDSAAAVMPVVIDRLHGLVQHWRA